MPLDAETLELDIAFVPADPRLPFGDRDLLLDRVHPFEVGKEQPAAPSFRDDDAVFAHIEIVEPGGRLRLLKDVDRIFEIVELVGRNGRETRILARREHAVADDLAGQVGLGRVDGSDAAPQLSVLVERDESPRATAQQLQGSVLGHFKHHPGRHEALDRRARQGDDGIYIPLPPDRAGVLLHRHRHASFSNAATP